MVGRFDGNKYKGGLANIPIGFEFALIFAQETAPPPKDV